MDTNNPIPKTSFRWLALLGGTVGVHLLVVAALVFVTVLQVAFDGGQDVFLIAIMCLPAAWSVFILWKFRRFAERVVGIIAAISSLLELSELTNWFFLPIQHH
jgi:hypothetical protein